MKDNGAINEAAAAKINTPAAGAAHIYRSTVDNLFYAKLSDGSSVLIGGIAPGGGSQMAVEVVVGGSATTYTANPIGGTAPFTYAWTNKYRAVGSAAAAAAIASGGTTATVTLTQTGAFGALLACKVTDANGLVALGYYRVDGAS